jgi:hypothetical protein
LDSSKGSTAAADSAAKVVVLFTYACFILMNVTDQGPR